MNFLIPAKGSIKRHRLAVFFYFFCQGIAFASWASRIPIIKNDLTLTESQLGSILLMLPIGQLLTLPLTGFIINKFGSRYVLGISSILYAIALCGIGLTSNIYSLAGVLFIFGIFSNICNIAVNIQGVEIENMYNKSIMSSFHGGWSLAGFIGALIGLFTINFHISNIQHFVIILAFFTLNAIFNFKFLLPIRETTPPAKQKKGIKADMTLIQLGLIGFFSMATEGAMFDWTGVYFQDIVKAPSTLITLGYTAFMIMMATGRFIGDKMISKYGKAFILQLSGALMFIGMITPVLIPTLAMSTTGFMLVGLGVACCVPTVYSVTGQYNKIPAGTAMTIVSSVSFLGFLLGPPLIGYIAEWSSLRWSFCLFSIFGLMMIILVKISPMFKSK